MFELKDNKQNIHLYFETKSHELDVEILGDALISLSRSIQTLASESGESPLNIKVKALKKGSFDAILSVVAGHPETIEFIKTLPDYIKCLIDLYKFMKGKAPRNVEHVDKRVKIENEDGISQYFDRCVFNTYNFSSKPPLGNADKLSQDKEIKAIEVRTNPKNKIARIEKENFKDFIPPAKLFDDKENKTDDSEAELIIYKLIFGDFSSRWGFIYNGTKISAKITDAQFQEKIKSGHPFKYGDRLKAILRTTKKYDHFVKTFIPINYEVQNVLEYHPREVIDQPELGLS